MHIEKGRDRIVVVLPFFGVVIKFPIIHVWLALRLLWRVTKSNDKWEYLKQSWEWSIEHRYGFKGLLFGGLFANWREFKFYCQTRNSFLQPTYLSLGFMNIQRYDEPCTLKTDDLWCQLHELTNGDVFDDCHHFANPRNFCFEEGKLRMVDYGGLRSHSVILKHGEKIFQLFNSSYDWEEEKKKIKC